MTVPIIANACMQLMLNSYVKMLTGDMKNLRLWAVCRQHITPKSLS